MISPSEGPAPTAIGLDLRAFNLILLLGFVAVAALGLIAESVDMTLGEDWLFGFYAVISLSYEENLPGWYLMGLYLLACGLASVLFADDRSSRRSGLLWLGLATLFLWLSFDGFTAFTAKAFAASRPAFRPELLETAVEKHSEILIGIGTAIALFLVLAGRLCIQIAGQWLTLPALCQVPLAAGLGAIATAPLVEEWSFPLRLWYRLGGHEDVGSLVSTGLDWLESSIEIAGASLVCAALVRILAARRRELVIALEAPAPARVQAASGIKA